MNKELLKSLREDRRQVRHDFLKRNVGVLGATNLRTHLDKLVIALHKESSYATSRWFNYEPLLNAF